MRFPTPSFPSFRSTVASLLVALSVSFTARADETVAPAPPPPPAAPESPPALPVPQAEPVPTPEPAPVVTPEPPPAAVVVPVAAPGPKVAIAAASSVAKAKKEVPWRGSLLYYGHGISALTLNKSAEPWYNPNYSHHLDFWLEWHWTDKLFTRATYSLGQEFTQGDDTNSLYEIVGSDLNFDTGLGGLELPAGFKAGAMVRLSLPTSKASQAQTRLFGLGPVGILSRKFNVAGGINVIYLASFNWRFHRSTTAENNSPELVACGLSKVDACQDYFNTGMLNAWGALGHGPRVLWTPTEKLMFIGYFSMSDSFLYRLSPAQAQFAGSTQLTNENTAGVRYSNAFGLIANYEVTKQVGLSLSVATAGGQLAPDSTYRNPFFNRYSTFSLDAVIDIEAITESLSSK